jgi:hypothetical protein
VASARAVTVGGWFSSCGVTVGPICGALSGMRNRHDTENISANTRVVTLHFVDILTSCVAIAADYKEPVL